MTNSPTPDDRLTQLEGDTRTTLAAISVMQQLTAQLVELSRVQQESLARHEQRMEAMQTEIVQLRQESRQIWEHLLRQSPNGN